MGHLVCNREDLLSCLSFSITIQTGHVLNWNHSVVEGKDRRIEGLLANKPAQDLIKDLVSKE